MYSVLELISEFCLVLITLLFNSFKAFSILFFFTFTISIFNFKFCSYIDIYYKFT